MRIKSRIKTIMNDSKRGRLFSLESLLTIAEIGYRLIVRLRAAGYRVHVLPTRKLPCYVISIGNLTVGGTGKTPVTVYVAELLQRHGYQTVVISRGYKGKAEKKGGIVCDGTRILIDPIQAGDEPWMMAKRLNNIPIIVGANRFEAGRRAIKQFNPQVILLDDAFQHLKLFRDLDLVLLDHQRPYGNSRLLPRGPLREPAAAIQRADAVVLTRSSASDPDNAAFYHKPVFQCAHVPRLVEMLGANSGRPDPESLQGIQGKRVFAFSGIANNDAFLQTLRGFKCHIVGFAEFGDHHRYTDQDLSRIVRSASDRSAEIISTTEKDYARIRIGHDWSIGLVVVGIDIAFRDEAFDRFILNRIEQTRNQGI